MTEDSDFVDIVAVVKNGVSWAEANAMHPLERRAFLYVIAKLNGGVISWETGEVRSAGS